MWAQGVTKNRSNFPAPLCYIEGVEYPCGEWVHSPVAHAFEHAEYDYLVRACKMGVIHTDTFKRWCDLCFRGNYPDWLYKLGAERKDPWVYASMSAALAALPSACRPEPGTFTWDESVIVGKPVSTVDAAKVVDAWVMAMVVDGPTIEACRPLKLLFPTVDKPLEQRQRFTVPLAALCAVRSLGTYTCFSPATIGGWLRKCAGVGGACIANILMYAASGERFARVVNELIVRGVFSHGLAAAAEVLKHAHDTMRRADHVPSALFGRACNLVAVEEVLYLKMLIGRYYVPSLSDDGTIADRAERGGDFASPYASEDDPTGAEWFYARAESYLNVAGYHFASGVWQSKLSSPDEFRARYINYGTGGSASSGRQDIAANLALSKLPTKRLWLASLKDGVIPKLLDLPPTITTTVVTKREPGKLRQLLPGPVYHWLLESVALAGGEGEVFRNLQEVKLERAGLHEWVDFSTRMARSANAVPHVDIDHSDFNRIHTTRMMQRLWDILGARAGLLPKTGTGWGGVSYPEFVAAACERLGIMVYGMWAKREVGDDELTHMLRGLWSGWRSTSFINNVLNWVYTKVCSDIYQDVYGHSAFCAFEVVGDDANAVVRSELDALRFTCVMQAAGFDLNPAKQLVSQGRQEFLRIIYNGGIAKGSLVRAIANGGSSDMQTEALYSDPFALRGHCDMMSNLIRRGADAESVGTWWDDVLQYWGAGTWSVKRVRKSAMPSRALMYCPQSQGGLGAYRYGQEHGSTDVKIVLPRAPVWRAPVAHILREAPLSGIKLAVKSASAKVHSVGLECALGGPLSDSLARATLAEIVDDEVVNKARSQYRKAVGEWILLCNAMLGGAAESLARGSDQVQSAQALLRKMADEAVSTVVELDAKGELSASNFSSATAVGAVVDGVLATALGTSAPCPDLINSMWIPSGRLSAIGATMLLGGPSVRSGVAHLLTLLPPATLDRLLAGSVSLSTPTYGRLAPPMVCLLNSVLNSCLAALNARSQCRWLLSAANLASTYAHLSAYASAALSRSRLGKIVFV